MVEGNQTTTRGSTVSVAIVEDQTTIREGLAMLIDSTEGFRCSGRYGSVEQAAALIARDVPDVVLMDIQLPGQSGIEGVRLLKQRHVDTTFLMLSIYNDDERIFQALCAGASGYLLKKTPPAKLLEAIGEAARGGGPMSPEVAHRVIRLFREFRPPAQSDEALTPHETRVLQLFADGHDYVSAAAALDVARSTVAYHMKLIFRKLQTHSQTEAVAKALRAGWVK